MAEKNLDTLFHDTLKDIYYAERAILKALPKMARGAQSPDLKQAFVKHKEETQGQVERLQQVFELIGKRAQGKTCPAIDGIIEEGEEIIAEYKGSPALDAGLIAAAQAVEHYEITRYGTLKRWAEVLDMSEAVTLLDATLQEEAATDETLTELADSAVNQQAARGRGGRRTRRGQTRPRQKNVSTRWRGFARTLPARRAADSRVATDRRKGMNMSVQTFLTSRPGAQAHDRTSP